jgi:hypothetical protein
VPRRRPCRASADIADARGLPSSDRAVRELPRSTGPAVAS